MFALLNSSSTGIVTLILLDGDFLNYDFELHKASKYSNYTEYNHGPYEEGSIRHRKMYTYPNPLNSKIEVFYMRKILVVKKNDLIKINETSSIYEQIIRTDKYGNSFYYSLKDETTMLREDQEILASLTDIFDACKQRIPKERNAAVPVIPSLS